MLGAVIEANYCAYAARKADPLWPSSARALSLVSCCQQPRSARKDFCHNRANPTPQNPQPVHIRPSE
jgi:hypothetical protein